MSVTRSGYYSYLKKPHRKGQEKELQLIVKVKEIDKRSKGTYGSRRIAKSLQIENFKVGRYKARTLMKQANIQCKQRRRYKITTISNPRMAVMENKLNREFQVKEPNRVWVTDITYLWTKEGWLYIAAVLDLYSRRIIGWSLANHMRVELINDALEMALARRQPTKNLMHHSDRGGQYTSNDYQNKLGKLGIEVSMSRKGNCWDNAPAENFFSHLKEEMVRHLPTPSFDQLQLAVNDYVYFYNYQRIQLKTGQTPFETRCLSS
jgi:transposase InsO family protein